MSNWKNTIALLIIVAWPAPVFSSSLANAETFFERGKYYFAHKDYARAAISFELAMQRNPANADALYYDALTYQQAGDLQRAKALYKHAMAIFPGTKAALYSFAALKELDKQLATGKPAQPPPNLLASAAPPPAAPAPKAAEKPADPVADLIKAGAVLQEDGRGSEAERDYMAALNQAEKGGQNNPKIADALQALGDYYADIGSYGKACDSYRRELRVREVCQRDNPDAIAGCMTRQANIYTKDGDYGTSEELLRRSVDIYQNELDAAERYHKRSTSQRQKLVAAKGSLAAILRVTNRGNEAKMLEQEAKYLSQPQQLQP